MKNCKKSLAAILSLLIISSLAACQDSDEHGYLMEASETTPAVTVELNTQTLAPEEEEQLANLADNLSGELENKTVKWMSFYDPWHPTGQGNFKPVSMELFEKKFGGIVEYYPTTWENQYNDLANYILGGEGIDFFPAAETIPGQVINGMTQSCDSYIDWNAPLWSTVKTLNDNFAVGGSHYLMICQATEGYVVYYNRKTIEENGFDDPADLYASGDWTMTKFRQMLEEFVDNDSERYGLDGWFIVSPLYLSSGVPSVSLENGKAVSNFENADFERAMTYQYELFRKGLILDKSLFGWTPQIQYMGEGKELFYISGLYEIESAPDIWTRTFGEQGDVFFVPIPRDEEADKYYYNAELDCYNLCQGAGNPEGVIKLMECVIASYDDENAQAISDKKHIDDYGWSQEMIDMRNEVRRLTQENPVRDIRDGLTSDLSSLIGDAVGQPILGTDWYSVRESNADAINIQIDEINRQIDVLG
ncbi:MAG: carbohydrate ABC transporter substrate-binding protein [Eubacterium sp.]|nr:carbohydrate ABC transporter substrate-binding protein [Eubacterium sp.]